MYRVALFQVRVIWKVFSRTASVVILPFSILSWVLRLIPHFSEIARADAIGLGTAPTGFGHSVLGPDMLRRMYQGQRCLFFVASWRYENNPKVSLLWTDIKVVFVPRFISSIPYNKRVIAIPFLGWHDAMVVWVTRKLVGLLSGGCAKFLTLCDIYQEVLALNNASLLSAGEKNKKVRFSGMMADVYLLTAQLYLFQNRIPAPSLHLPTKIKADITTRLQRLWQKAGHDGQAKICCLYLRFENRDAANTKLRNSSSLANHLPAIRLLNEAGYQVLLTGDFKIDAAIRHDRDGALVDSQSLGLEKDIYLLFAASEADVFIGNHGGGVVLAMINEIPSLFLDCFPYSIGRKNSWVYPKAARDKEGRPLPGRLLITDFVYDLTASFGTLLNNTEEEITDAVACFVEDVTNLDNPDPYADIAALIPQDTQFHITGARLSPAWVRRNILNEDMAMKAWV